MSFPPPITGAGAGSGATPSPRTSAASPAVVELAALLGRGTHYAGKLYFEGRVRIEGHFEGEIRGADVLIIGDGAVIEGDIEVGACIVTGGHVTANIRAREAIELHVPAVVRGDLHAPAIFIDRGVSFEGRCRMAPLDAAETPPPERVATTAPPPAVDAPAARTEATATAPVGATLAGEPPRGDES
ncbi:MAG: polymer-forming cytoskeletal protein [Myxococcales bacterium]|nr:polymer-forming cytoskeletal protein [Myxococcales bacterium]